MNHDKIDDEDSIAQTIRPPVRFSQKPTIPVPPKVEPQIIKQYSPMKYKFYLIGTIIIAIIITAIICITKPLKSYSMPERSIFNLAPIVIPAESASQIKIIEVTIPSAASSIKPAIPQPVKKIEIKKSPKDKDYGI